MSSKKKRVVTVKVSDPEHLKGEHRSIGGSRSDDWNNLLAGQTIESLRTREADPEFCRSQHTATVQAMMGITPRDELEGMATAQLIAAHSAAMECFRRGMISEQSFEGRAENLRQANKLCRTWAILLDALDKHRGKGQQKVTVEHVHVHAGGQAVVGSIETAGGGGLKKPEDQPYAPHVGDAREPEMRSSNAEGERVPVSRDGER